MFSLVYVRARLHVSDMAAPPLRKRSCNKIGQDGATALAPALEGLTNLKDLYL